MSSESPRTQGTADLATLGLTALAILVADQVTKAAVVAFVGLGERVEVVGDFILLWHIQNRGAAFSLFQGNLLLFYVVTLIAFGVVIYYHRALRGKSRLLQLIPGLLLGGTLGNLVDRLRLGYVTDFVSVGFGDLRFPAFNVADSSIVIGLGSLVVYLFWADAAQREAPA